MKRFEQIDTFTLGMCCFIAGLGWGIALTFIAVTQ